MSVSDPPLQFEAVIVPHRSLGPSGLRWVVGVLCVMSAGLSTGLWLVGAWPVIGFTGLEVALAVWLLRRNARGARSSEMLLLSEEGLRIVRIDHAGRRRERRLESYWLRARLQERPGRTPALLLQDRSSCLEVGGDLGEVQKRQLAAALYQALDRHRNPVFDNPQLRAG